MTTTINKALIAAVIRLLRPLVRLLLRNGVSFGTFADMAKWVYVDVASKEFNVGDRKQTDTRISTITGLTRKDVARIKQIAVPDDAVAEKNYNRAARVIGGWINDRRFTDQRGAAAILPFEGTATSFSDLVKAYSGDMTARAILDELLRVGAVEYTPQKEIRLVANAYIPTASDDSKMHILGSDVASMIATIDHNIAHDRGDARFQRKVEYNNLPEEALPKLKRLVETNGQALLEHLNDYLAQHDRDANPAAQGTGRKRAGVGIYYFEEDVSEEK